MSLWERYFAPGDIRRQREQRLAAQNANTEETISRTTRRQVPRTDPATRARRQNGLLLGGIIFTAFSILATRRAVARKVLTASSGATQSIEGVSPSVTGGLDAAQALSLATINVFSMGMLALGVTAKIMDIADVEDLRDRVRKGIGFDVYGGDEKADKELEEWVADVLSRKDGVLGLKESVAMKLAELQNQDAEKRKR